MAKLPVLACFLLLITFVFSSYSSTDAFSKTPRRSLADHSLHRTGLLSNTHHPVSIPTSSPSSNLHTGDMVTLFAATGSTSFNSTPVTTAPHRLSVHQMVYLLLTSTFVTCLIIADVIGVKIFELKLPFSLFGHNTVEHTCGMITFPITFLLGDVINEYFGAKATKTTVYIGLVMSILVFIVMNIAQALPYLQKPFNVTPAAFDMIFGSAKLMYIASIVAYLVGQLSDIWLFGIIKKLTNGKYLWLRATGSTVISQMLDSFVVSYIAFSFGKKLTNQVPATLPEVMNIAVTGYALKFVIAGLITPFLYLIRNFLHTRYGFEPLPVDYSEDE